MLTHLPLGKCPFAREMRIEALTMGEVLKKGRVDIPIFQRRYCWTRKEVGKWFQDLATSKGEYLVGHRLGKVVFSGLLCIDGQQRITTTFLLLAALRDVKADESIDAVLGDDDQRRLRPTYSDRDAFERAMTGRPSEGPLGEAKAQLDGLVAEFQQDGGDPRFLLDRALNFFTVMYTQCHATVHLPQLFLWTQEKAFFSLGSLLANKAPGRRCRLSDLVRNLLLAPIIEKSHSDQLAFYESFWLPLESRFSSPDDFDSFLTAVASSSSADDSPLAHRMLAVFDFLRVEPSTEVLTYARFVSFWEASNQDPAAFLTDLHARFDK